MSAKRVGRIARRPASVCTKLVCTPAPTVTGGSGGVLGAQRRRGQQQENTVIDPVVRCYRWQMAHLFDPLSIRDLTFANRVFVSPMCEYSSVDGCASDWHFVHLGSRAVGGAGLVLTEATAILPEGRISPQDLGIWSDDHIEPLARIVRFIHEQGSVAGMQLAHAGRKASTYRPWEGQGTVPEQAGGWQKVVAPSALAFTDSYPMPHALTSEGIQGDSRRVREGRTSRLRGRLPGD